MARKDTTHTQEKEIPTMPITDVKISNVKWWNNDSNATFNLEIPTFAITVYGMGLHYADDEPFLTFPSRKSNDGKYWKHVYISFPLEMKEDIINQVEEA